MFVQVQKISSDTGDALRSGAHTTTNGRICGERGSATFRAMLAPAMATAQVGVKSHAFRRGGGRGGHAGTAIICRQAAGPRE
jgi:hypothetical protein